MNEGRILRRADRRMGWGGLVTRRGMRQASVQGPRYQAKVLRTNTAQGLKSRITKPNLKTGPASIVHGRILR